jgi:5-methyltetrahydropteroyltriglutamate--homocysteine methyltransferase
MAQTSPAGRIRTTHVGSLPRPPELLELLVKREAGEPVDAALFEERCAAAVDDVVARQLAAGIDIVNDGEMSKFAYSTYIKNRLSGITGYAGDRRLPADVRAFPGFAARMVVGWGVLPACDGPLALKDAGPLEADLRHLRAAATKTGAADLFMTAASPGLTATFIPNRYYASHEAYLAALVDVLRVEYEAIVAAGFTLQLDCPDLASARNNTYAEFSDAEFAARQVLAVEAINAATANIDPQRMRLHLCWGNYEGPHHLDIPLEAALPVACTARPAAISFEGANPRHEHEWALFADFDLPDGKTIIPGVIDSTTNFIEHPEVVAQRIERYARRLGADRVIAGVDCGFGTTATQANVDPEIVWAKLRSLAEGAALASERL